METNNGNKLSAFRWPLLLAVLMLADLYLIFLYAPREAVMGDLQRIFYFHVPIAWNALLAFGVTFVYGVRYLRSRRIEFDRVAAASAELGTLFTTLVLITGSLWGRGAWGAWWVWEPRLTTAFILWLMYVFYLLLRRQIANPETARRFSAVYGCVAFINVPISFMSIRWWRSIHPVVIEARKVNLEPAMIATLAFSLVTFTLFYLMLLRQRVRQARLEGEVQEMKEQLREELR